jgi:hypothetical protein
MRRLAALAFIIKATYSGRLGDDSIGYLFEASETAGPLGAAGAASSVLESYFRKQIV